MSMDEQFRTAMYDACRQMGLEIVSFDTAARILAWVSLQAGDERMAMCPRLRCELRHVQELYHITGGEIPDADFCDALKGYILELKDYTETHDGEWPQWLYDLIQERYGFKPYKL